MRGDLVLLKERRERGKGEPPARYSGSPCRGEEAGAGGKVIAYMWEKRGSF